jgi:ABC-type branched-subunit amino acid transport system substrate-binding protein
MKVRVLVVCAVLGMVLASCGRDDPSPDASKQTATTQADAACGGEALQATDVGITEDTITIEVMADTGNALAPGLFQGNIDAVKAYAGWVNDHGGVACRDLVVKEWDSKLNPDEAKNGQIDACQNAFAMVGGNALFNPDVSTIKGCKDKAGAATGLPDLPGTANDSAELCNETTYMAAPVAQRCPVVAGQPVHYTASTGTSRYFKEKFGPGKGMYMIPGDLPTTIQSAMFIIRGLEEGGSNYVYTPKVSGRTEQAGYTPLIQTMRQQGIDFVTDGLTDTAMILLRREAKAQGYDDQVKVWTCIPSCYSKAFKQAAADVDGTYVTLSNLPFEEKDTNENLAAFVDSVGIDNANGFGALAWQAATLFKQAVDDVVKAKGPNGLTRAAFMDALDQVKDFDAGGWAAKKATLRSASPCFVILQLRDGEFHRVFPEKRGTLDCNDDNLVSFDLDPAAEAAKLP